MTSPSVQEFPTDQLQNLLIDVVNVQISSGTVLGRMWSRFASKKVDPYYQIANYRGSRYVPGETHILSSLFLSFPEPSLLESPCFFKLSSHLWTRSLFLNPVGARTDGVCRNILLLLPTAPVDYASFVEQGNAQLWGDAQKLDQAMKIVREAAAALFEDPINPVKIVMARSKLICLIEANHPQLRDMALNALLNQLQWECLDRNNVRADLSHELATAVSHLLNSLKNLAGESAPNIDTMQRILQCCYCSCELYLRHFKVGNVGGLPSSLKDKASESIKLLEGINQNDPIIHLCTFRLKEGLKRLHTEEEIDYQDLLKNLSQKVAGICTSVATANYVQTVFQVVDLGIFIRQQLKNTEFNGWFEQLWAAQELAMTARVSVPAMYALIDLFLAQLNCAGHPRLMKLGCKKEASNANAPLALGLLELIAKITEQTRDPKIRLAGMALLIDVEQGSSERETDPLQWKLVNESFREYAKKLRINLFKQNPEQALLLLIASTLYHTCRSESNLSLNHLPMILKSETLSCVRDFLTCHVGRLFFSDYWLQQIESVIKVSDLKIEGSVHQYELLLLFLNIHNALENSNTIKHTYIPRFILNQEQSKPTFTQDLSNRCRRIEKIWSAMPKLVIQLDHIDDQLLPQLVDLLEKFPKAKIMSNEEPSSRSLVKMLCLNKTFHRAIECARLAIAYLKAHNQSSNRLRKLKDLALFSEYELSEYEFFSECIARDKQWILSSGIPPEHIKQCVMELKNFIKGIRKKVNGNGFYHYIKNFENFEQISFSINQQNFTARGVYYEPWEGREGVTKRRFYSIKNSKGQELHISHIMIKAIIKYGFYGSLFKVDSGYYDSLFSTNRVSPEELADFFQIKPEYQISSLNQPYKVTVPEFGEVIDETGAISLHKPSECSVNFNVLNRNIYEPVSELNDEDKVFEPKRVLELKLPQFFRTEKKLEIKRASSPLQFQMNVKGEAIGCLIEHKGTLYYYSKYGRAATRWWNFEGGRVVTYHGVRKATANEDGLYKSKEAVYFNGDQATFFSKEKNAPGYKPKPKLSLCWLIIEVSLLSLESLQESFAAKDGPTKKNYLNRICEKILANDEDSAKIKLLSPINSESSL